MITMIKTSLITILFVMATIISIAQPLSHFEVDLSKATNGIDVPVSVSLDKLKISTGSSFSLVEIKGGKTLPVAFQVNKEEKTISWIIRQNGGQEKKHRYQVVKSAPGK